VTAAATAEDVTPDAPEASGGLLVGIALHNRTGGDATGVRLRLPVPAGTRVDAPAGGAAPPVVTADGVAPAVTWTGIGVGAGERAGPFSCRLVPAPGEDGAAVFRRAAGTPEVTWPGAAPGAVVAPTLRLNGLWGESGLRRTALPGGLVVLTRERPETATVSLMLGVRAGSRDEDDATSGGSHWLEHAHFLGTARRPSNQALFAPVQNTGGQMNASTSFEWTNYYNTVPAEEFDLALDVLADQLLNSTFPRAAFDRERQVVVEEVKRAYDDPASRATREFLKLVFQVSPVRREVLGTPESVGSIPIETILAYRDRLYVAGNMALAAVGSLQHDAAVAKIEAAFGALPRGPRHERPRTPEPVQSTPRRLDLGDGGRLAEIRLGWPAPGRDDPDWPATVILQDVLGTTGRRLTEEIRDRRALATAIGPGYSVFSDAGAFFVGATTQPGNVEPVIGLALAEVRRLRAGQVTDEDVGTSLRAIAGRRALGDEFNQAQAGKAVAEVAGTLDSAAEYLAQLRPVAAADVQRVARTYLDPDAYTLVVVRA
jgi:zinc protease